MAAEWEDKEEEEGEHQQQKQPSNIEYDSPLSETKGKRMQWSTRSPAAAEDTYPTTKSSVPLTRADKRRRWMMKHMQAEADAQMDARAQAAWEKKWQNRIQSGFSSGLLKVEGSDMPAAAASTKHHTVMDLMAINKVTDNESANTHDKFTQPSNNNNNSSFFADSDSDYTTDSATQSPCRGPLPPRAATGAKPAHWTTLQTPPASVGGFLEGSDEASRRSDDDDDEAVDAPPGLQLPLPTLPFYQRGFRVNQKYAHERRMPGGLVVTE